MKKTAYGEEIPERLLHLSFNGDLYPVLEPRLPAGSDMESGKYKETDIPRISMAPSITHCFRAIYPNISHFFEELKYPYIFIYVYEIYDITPEKLIGPIQSTKERLIHDAMVTKEFFSTVTVKAKLIDKIRIANTSNEDFLRYKPYGTESERDHSPKRIRFQKA